MTLLVALALSLLLQGTDCRFQLGFAAVHAQIPEVVGQCLEDEHHNPANGDALQRTTGGLLVWRKSDNWTAFTDGHRTWVNGPFGLQMRLNADRFPWEGPERLAWPAGPVTTEQAAQLARTEAARALGIPPEQVTVERAEPVQWSDTSLGCAQPDRLYASVIVDGHRVVLAVAGRAVHVHAGQGTALLCPSPTQSPAAP